MVAKEEPKTPNKTPEEEQIYKENHARAQK